MSLQDFLAYPHLRLYLPGLTRENTSMVDDVLGQYGVHRSIALETTQFSSAVGVLTAPDSLLVANAGFQEGGLYRERIVGHEMPAELQRMIRNTNSCPPRQNVADAAHPNLTQCTTPVDARPAYEAPEQLARVDAGCAAGITSRTLRR